MTDKPEQIEPNLTPAEFQEIEKTELYRALIHPKFRRGLRAIARHARAEQMEGGLAVYKTGQTLNVAQPVMPTPEELNRTSGLMPVAQAFGRGYEGFNASSLILEEAEEHRWRPRRDIVLFVHSHPLETVHRTYTPAEMLCPSVQDVEAFENLSVFNPDHTEGVLVSSKQGTDLLLYKKSPSRDYMQYYKRFERANPVPAFLASLEQGGINLATINIANDPDYNLRAATAVAELNR